MIRDLLYGLPCMAGHNVWIQMHLVPRPAVSKSFIYTINKPTLRFLCSHEFANGVGKTLELFKGKWKTLPATYELKPVQHSWMHLPIFTWQNARSIHTARRAHENKFQFISWTVSGLCAAQLRGHRCHTTASPILGLSSWFCFEIGGNKNGKGFWKIEQKDKPPAWPAESCTNSPWACLTFSGLVYLYPNFRLFIVNKH